MLANHSEIGWAWRMLSLRLSVQYKTKWKIASHCSRYSKWIPSTSTYEISLDWVCLWQVWMNIPVLFVFIRGLRDNLRAEAMREHPRTSSDAFVAARTAARLCSVVHYDMRRVTPNTREQKKISNDIQTSMRPPPRRKLQDEERKKLMREGKCFKS